MTRDVLVHTAMGETDAQMVRGVERTRGKVLDELTKLLNKLRNSRQNREGTGMRQIRRVEQIRHTGHQVVVVLDEQGSADVEQDDLRQRHPPLSRGCAGRAASHSG